MKQNISPPQAQLNRLLEHYQNGRLNDAEKLANSISHEFPSHNFSWKILGVVLKARGRNSEAVNANQTAVALSPEDAEAHSNLGITLQEIGRLDEALASYTQAIALKPDFAQAHYNLGITLQELGRLEDAAASYTQAIALKPDFGQAHYNLGVTLQELGRLDEALASYTQAIGLKPDFGQAHNNLGSTLKELGRLDEALASYTQAIAFKPEFAQAHYNLGNTLQELGRLEDAAASYTQAIVLNKKEPLYVGAYANLITYLDEACAAHFKLEKLWKESSLETSIGIMLPLAINRFLMGDLKGCRQLFLSHCSGLSEPQKLELNNGNNYWGWLRFLLDWHAENPPNENSQLPLKTLYVIGDSHSLAYHGITLKIGNDTFSCKSEWIWGCKQFHIGNQKANKFKYKLDKLFRSLPPASSVLLSIGEIDCRLDDGIIPHCKKNPGKKIQRVISATAENYLDYILEKSSAYLHKVTIQGVPCPNVDRATFEKQEIEELIELIQKFNKELEVKTISYGLRFLDLSTITNDSNGFSNKLWHADTYHITPDGALEALRYHKFK